jgi:hypothetical protein
MVQKDAVGVPGNAYTGQACLHWPGMNSEIKDMIAKCSTCRTYEIANTPEPLMSQEVPERPCAKVGVDLFKFGDIEYLCTVDYTSNFWEVDRLDTTESHTVIKKLKKHFARYGIPDQVVSDNGPQFSSQEFAKFANKWMFTHTTTSPYNSKGNGKVESAVKTAKSLFRKAELDGADPYLVMLDHRNTPNEGLLSPAQKFLSRRTKTLLPTTENLLRPQVHECAKQYVKFSQKRQRLNFKGKAYRYLKGMLLE